MGPDHRPGINSIFSRVCVYKYVCQVQSWEVSIRSIFFLIRRASYSSIEEELSLLRSFRRCCAIPSFSFL